MQAKDKKQIFIDYKTYRIEFCQNQGMLLIVCQSLDHSTKGQGKYSDDTIRQLSNDLLENIDDFMEFVQLNQNQQQAILITEAGNLEVNFKYIMNKKEKVKKIQFSLAIQEIDAITVLKMENFELKRKVNTLENQMANLKNQLGNKIHNLEAKITAFQNKKIATFDQLFVRGITFTNSWKIGYYDSNQYLGFMCGDYPKGHWLRKTEESKYLKDQ